MENLFLRKMNVPSEYKFEAVRCYNCGGNDYSYFLTGEDDLTAKEGQFQYVKCNHCELVYQHPRLVIGQIKSFYDDDYLAHRKRKRYGMLTPLVDWTLNKHDRVKERIIRKYCKLYNNSEILDVGCAVGTFLLYMEKKYKCRIAGVDFKEDLDFPGFSRIDFYQGLFYEQEMKEGRFDLITMWHFLEHDYDPNSSLQMAARVLNKNGKLIIEVPRLDSLTFRLFGRRWPGVQAPQHTAMYSRKTLVELLEKNGFKILKYLPYGAFPPFFYIFAGSYFRLMGKGLRLNRVLIFYVLAEIIFTPLLLFHKYLNLSMQTIVCGKS